MITSILIIISCAVYFLIVSLCYAFCSITRISRICAKRDEIILELWTVNDYQCNQIDQLICTAKDQNEVLKDQNEVLNRFVNILDNLKLKLETEYLTKKQLKNLKRTQRSKRAK